MINNCDFTQIIDNFCCFPCQMSTQCLTNLSCSAFSLIHLLSFKLLSHTEWPPIFGLSEKMPISYRIFTHKKSAFLLFSGLNIKASQTQCLRNPIFSSFSLSSLLSSRLSSHSHWSPKIGLSKKSYSIWFIKTKN